MTVTLNGYIEVPSAATVGGAPIDAFQADAFRRNDLFFEKVLRALFSAPLVGNGSDGVMIDPPAKQIVHATTITVNSLTTLEPRVPLIWFARESITIKRRIDAQGKGAQPTEDGDFGGSGGGGAAAGKACKLPVSGHQILAGGAIGAVGNNLTADWASRALSILALCKGGAAGGDATGGAGGGVVVLCAPVINIDRSAGNTGEIVAKGADGTGGGGGGGGGLVILIGNEITGTAGHVDFAGGGGAGAGGIGLFMERKFT
jgi:hypothetical protein